MEENKKTGLTVLEGNAQNTENRQGVYVHIFKNPYEYEDKKFETINFNFDKLTGKDMISIENEMQAMGEFALSPEISRAFQCRMAAKAGKIATDTLEMMPFFDFIKITNAARDFLLYAGL